MISNSLALNFTVICMYKDKEGSGMESQGNGTGTGTGSSLSSRQQPMFDEFEQGLLFSGVAIGSLVRFFEKRKLIFRAILFNCYC
jgi:hypothetical protein